MAHARAAWRMTLSLAALNSANTEKVDSKDGTQQQPANGKSPLVASANDSFLDSSFVRTFVSASAYCACRVALLLTSDGEGAGLQLHLAGA